MSLASNFLLENMALAEIQSGDLLAWRRDSHNTVSDLLIQGIRIATASRYGHVGIAWRCHDGLDDELLVIEASIPRIRIARVIPDLDFECIPMGISWNDKGKEFLISKIGKKYSMLDAIRAYFGITLADDDSYQCVELAHYFYEIYGIKLEHRFTPGSLVQAASKYSGHLPRRVVERLPCRLGCS